MTADILAFPARAAGAGERGEIVRGDIIVSLWHEELSLWCAWVVEVVGPDGHAQLMRLPDGSLIGAEMVLSGRNDLHVSRAAHKGGPFDAMCHKVWGSRDLAVAAFAAVAL